jgi:hypothetical protein
MAALASHDDFEIHDLAQAHPRAAGVRVRRGGRHRNRGVQSTFCQFLSSAINDRDDERGDPALAPG